MEHGKFRTEDQVQIKSFNQCVVPENIHNPHGGSLELPGGGGSRGRLSNITWCRETINNLFKNGNSRGKGDTKITPGMEIPRGWG